MHAHGTIHSNPCISSGIGAHDLSVMAFENDLPSTDVFAPGEWWVKCEARSESSVCHAL